MEIGYEGWITITVILVGLITLFKDWAGPDFVFIGMLALVMTCKIITLEEGLLGFSNSAPLTVAALFVVAIGISETGGLDVLLGSILGQPKRQGSAMIRMMIPVTIVSAFMNNTPVVAILIPIIASWCHKMGFSPKQFYMPLSFASMLGGTCTLIGTSTNLVVAGQMVDAGYDEPGFFDIGQFGVAVAIWGLVYMYLFAPFLLEGKRVPVKSTKSDEEVDDERSFLIGLQVPESSPVVGQTVDNAGLRGLKNLYLASVQRGGHKISAVGPEFVIAKDDILYFTGILEDVQTLADRYNLRPQTNAEDDEIPKVLLGSPTRYERTLHESKNIFDISADDSIKSQEQPLTSSDQSLKNNRTELGSDSRKSIDDVFRLLQATVKENAPIIGNTIRDIGFRSRFNAAIIGVTQCGGKKIHGNLGDINLKAGDNLVLNLSSTFDMMSEDVLMNFKDMVKAGGNPEREFMVAMEIDDSALYGKTVESAGLRGLPQLFLVEIERFNYRSISAPSGNEVLREGDILWFAGELEGIRSLTKIKGLRPVVENQIGKLHNLKEDRRLVQAVVSQTSELVGRTVFKSRFRTKYHAAIIGVHRQGHRIKEKIGDITLKGGDVLLLDTGTNFVKEYKNNRNFALVSEVENSIPLKYEKAKYALFALGAMVISQLIGVALDEDIIDLFTAAILASAFMLVTRCMTGDQARQSVNWTVIITISSAFGLSTAMENSNVATTIADALVSAGESLGGNFFVMLAMYLATMLLSNLVSNNAVAALMFTIAEKVALSKGISINQMSSLIMLAASAAYMSPFGYQTNLMVYAAGGYTIVDFIKFGAPMQIWLMVASICVIMLEDYLTIIYVISFSSALLIFSFVPIRQQTYKIYRLASRKQKKLPVAMSEASSTRPCLSK